MALYASEGGGGGNFTPIPEGTYPAICYAIIDMGDQFSEKFDKTSHKCKILWEVVGETFELDGKTINRSIGKDYTLSLNEKSALRKDLRAWRGREFTADELKKFNVKNILGVPCMMNIVHQTAGDKTYANIASIMAMPKGMPKPEQTNETTYWDFEENTIDDAMWQKIPQYIQDKIKESKTYVFLTTGNWDGLGENRMTEITEGAAFKALHSTGTYEVLEDDDLDCPF